MKKRTGLRWRRKALVLLLVALGLPLAALLVVLLYLEFGDLSRHRDWVAELLSDALGREVRIEGEFSPDIGLSSSLVATDLRLANPEWCSEPSMVAIDRLAFEIDLLSLLSGPIRIGRVEVGGAEVHLVDEGEGRVNWRFDPRSQPSEKSADPAAIVIERATLRDVAFSFRSPARSVAAGVRSFTLRSDAADALDVTLDGEVGGVPLEVSGTVGALPDLLAGGPIRHDLVGRLDEVELSLRGSLADLKTLNGTDVELEARGSGLGRISQLLGVEGFEPGAFDLRAEVAPSEAGFDVDFRASAGDLELEAGASVDSLLGPTRAEATLSAHGPTASAIGALGGFDGLPAEPFEVSGRVVWEGWPITFDAVEVRVGKNNLAIDGILGGPPLMEDTRLEVSGSGPSARSLGALFGLELPLGEYSVRGRVLRQAESLLLENVEAKVGASELEVTGVVGDPPGYEGTDLSIGVRGPDLSVLDGLVGVDLPNLPFEISGRLEPGDGAVTLEKVEGRVGANRVRLQGQVTTNHALAGTRLAVHVSGPDGAEVASIFGLGGVPALPYRIDGRVALQRGGARLRGVEATVGEFLLNGDGFVAFAPGREGSEASLEIVGPAVSVPAELVGLDALPDLPFRASGEVRVAADGYRLAGVTARIDDLELAVDGLIGARPGIEGTDARVRVEGPSLATLGAVLQQGGWPATPFTAASGVRVAKGQWALDAAAVDLGAVCAEASGTLVPAPGLVGSELDFEMSGGDLGKAGRLLAGADLPELPEKEFSGAGHVGVTEEGYVLRSVALTLGEASATLDGSIGSRPGFVGTDLLVDADGPEASLVTALTGVQVPIAPFKLRGRVGRHSSGVLFDRFEIRLGKYGAEIHGNVGEPPKLVGTGVEIHMHGPSTALFRELVHVPWLPDHPFQIDGHFSGNPEVFSMSGLSGRLGESDVSGSLRVDLTGEKPTVEAELRSDTVDLRSFLPARDEGEEAPSVGVGEAEKVKPRLLIPDDPFSLPSLDRFDGVVNWRASVLELPAARFVDLVLGLDLRDGSVRIDPIEATAAGGGVLTGHLVAASDRRGLAIQSRLQVENAHLRMLKKEADPSRRPTFNLDFDVDTHGRSLRELAGNANGWAGVAIGEGVVDNSVMDLLAADILVELLQTLNPFVTSRDETVLNCAVLVLQVNDGVVNLDPIALQSERMTIVGDGRIDLTTEKIRLDWVTKPRKGFGISASTITNPYIRLGGTLAKPSIKLRPIDAAVSTGAAVATMGLSLVGRGLWDRLTAERRVCKRALQQAEALFEEE